MNVDINHLRLKKTSLYMTKSSIDDDSIMKRRARDTLKRG